MASLSHSESRRKYSWWWDSHISPKNSKWLQDNLTDMDAKVKAMIKLIEEDADSFARRAEMYYKKRPELMKLVEEFYRAYRALAERYDFATVELRQAHRTMSEVFPNQGPYALQDDPLSRSSSLDGEANTPQTRHPIYSFLDEDDSSANIHSEESGTRVSRRGLKQFNEKSLKGHEAAYASAVEEAETEVQALKKALAGIQDEKEAALLQYQQSLEKLCRLERELEDAGGLSERASRAEIEIKVLKETLAKLEAERDADLLQHNECLERISVLESMIFQAQKETEGLEERATRAETESQSLKQELSALEAEKEAGLLQYKRSLELISTLENKLSQAEENARMLNELTERAETEIETLKRALSKLKEEKETAEVLYEQCLATIAIMEREISCAQEDVKRLNSEIVMGATKLRSAEEQCSLLERSNQSLHLEADNLVQKIQVKDQELTEKEDELQKLQALMQDEQSRFLQVEATLQTLQKLHSQSQEEQKALVLELQNKLQMLKDLELRNHDLQGDLQRFKDENQSLNESNSASSISITSLKDEISTLKLLIEKLERDVSLQVDYTNSLQQEIYNLKEEMERLNSRYQALLEQVHSVGLNPEGLSSSVKDLQDENMRLKEVCSKDRDERGALYEKLNGMNMLLQKNVDFERSLSELGGKLEGSREKVKELQESCQFLQGEKSGLAAEKAILLSQLQIMTENVQKLLEKNSLMENSLSGANIELEGLRTKSKSLEEFCQMLKNEKSCLLNEKSTLVLQLENVEKRLGMLEVRFTRLEEKYSDLEKQKETATDKVNELWSYIGLEKQERSYYMQSSESRLAGLESEVHLMQEEKKLSKKEFEEELDKAVNAQLEIFILQKFIKDLEEKNSSLFVECQKHVESSKLSNKVISELEAENLEQQVEVEFLLDEIENLRIGVQQVFKALQFEPVNVTEGLIEREQIPLTQVLDDVEDLKSSLLRNEDERQQLEVENLVLSTLLGESRSEGAELESQKIILEQEFKALTELHCVQNKNSQELLEMNRQLKLEVSSREEKEELLKAQLESRSVNFSALQASYQTLQEENAKELMEKRYLVQKFSDLKEEMWILEEENSSILHEALALGTLSTVFESCGSEKREELKALSEDFSSLHLVTNGLKKKVEVLEAKLEMKEMETLHLNARIEKLQQELLEGKDLNDELTYQIIVEKDFLVQKATEIVEMEEKLKATNTGNVELSRTIDGLMRECAESKVAKENFEKQVLELSRDGTNQRGEIEFLREANERLESEVRMLHKEVEERRAKEENLSLELQERNNESELWEAEASSFYFDLQMSCVHEVLLNNKVHELTAVSKSLQEENATKDTEIERMKNRYVSLESEIGELKAHLSAFVPVISSLRDTVDSLEHNSVRTKCFKDAEMAVQPRKLNGHEVVDDEGTMLRDGISDLLNMQARIKAVEKAMVEKAVAQEMGQPETREKVKAKGKLDSPVKGAKHLGHISRSGRESGIKEEMELDNKVADKVKSQKNKPEISDIRSILMKDIPLDQVSDRSRYRRSRSKRASSGTNSQVLELWESAEKNSYFDLMANPQMQEVIRSPKASPSKFKYARQKSRRRSFELQVEKEVSIDRLEVPTSHIREPKQEGSGGKILERLVSDVQKLISLETTVEELKKQMEMRKRSKNNSPEFERVDQQLQEVEAAVMQLIEATNKMKKDIEDIQPSFEGNISPGTSQRRRSAEQARKRSEKIGKLQFDVQSIQYVMLKLEDEKKSMGKHRFPGSRTGIILRDFISSGRRNSMRRKKSRFCGCVRPSANEDERTHLE